ncbi:MAG: response regulator, partial [Melioribacteraceae bacterium]
AIQSAMSGTFNLILMDIEMADVDGITATKKIREIDSPVSKIPIIAVTAHSSMKDRERCLAAGMDDYIAKPINIHFLKITIDQWLNSNR